MCEGETCGAAFRHRAPVVGEGHHRDGQCPGASQQPGVSVDAGFGAEQSTCVRVEQFPGGREINCRVADGEATEVQNGREAAVADEQVLGEQIFVSWLVEWLAKGRFGGRALARR